MTTPRYHWLAEDVPVFRRRQVPDKPQGATSAFDRIGSFCLPVRFGFESERRPKAGLETSGMRVTLTSALGL